MKIVRIRLPLNSSHKFRFLNLEQIGGVDFSESKGVLSLIINLKSGESLRLVSSKETKEVFVLKWEKFKTAEEMYFDLADFTLR